MAINYFDQLVQGFGGQEDELTQAIDALGAQAQAPQAVAPQAAPGSIEALMAGQQDIQRIQAERAAALANLSAVGARRPSKRLLREGQSFMEAFRDPSEAQREFAIRAGMALLSDDGTKSLSQRIGQALGSGAQGLQEVRQQGIASEAAQAKADLAQLQLEQEGVEQKMQFGQDVQKQKQQQFSNELRIRELLKPEGQSQLEKDLDKQTAASIGKIRDLGSTSFALDQDLNVMESLLDEGLGTGVGAMPLSRLQSLGSFLGIPDSVLGKVGASETFESLSNRMALRLSNPASGLGLKGAVSNKELDFLSNAVPNLGKSAAGNRLLIKVLRAQNRFKQDVAAEQERIIQANNGLPPADLDARLVSFANKHSVLTPEDLEEIRQVSKVRDPISPPRSGIESEAPGVSEGVGSDYDFVIN